MVDDDLSPEQQAVRQANRATMCALWDPDHGKFCRWKGTTTMVREGSGPWREHKPTSGGSGRSGRGRCWGPSP